MNLFTLVAELGLDDSKYKKGIKGAQSAGQSFAGGIVKSVSAGTIALGNLMSDAVKKAGDVVSGFVSKGIEYNQRMEEYVTNFKTLLGGSSEAASKMVGTLEEMAAKTPFAMDHLAGATQTLLAFGIESERVIPIMEMLGNVAMGDSEKFKSLARTFGQISAAGKLTGEDLNQLIDQGFNPLQTIAEETGASMSDLKAAMAGDKTSKDFKKLVADARKEVKKLGDEASDGAKWLAKIGEDGQISADIVEEVFKKVTSEGGIFAGAMENASQTFSGMMSTLEDNWNALLGDIMMPLSEFLTNTLLPNAIAVVDSLQKAFDEDGFSGLMEEIKNLVKDLGAKVIDALTEAKNKFTEKLPEFVEAIKTWATEKKEEVKTSAAEFLSGIPDSVATAVEKLALELPKILTTITEWVTGEKEKTKESGESLFAGFSDALPGAVEKIKTELPKIITTVSDWVTEKKEDLKQHAVDLLAGFPDALSDAVEKIKTELPKILTTITDWTITGKIQLATEAATFFAGITDELSNAISAISTELPKIITAIVDFVVLKAPEVLEQAKTLFAGLSSGVSSAITGITASLPDIISGFVTTVTENLPKLLELGGTMVGEIISGIVAAIPNILTAALGFALTLATEIGKYDWLSIGKNIIEGLLTGIKNAAKTSLESIKQAFVDIWTGVKEVFGISSPSTVAEEAGGFVLEGFAGGIKTGVTTFGETIKNAFIGIWEGIKGIFGLGKEKKGNEDAEDVGTGVVQGLADGLEDEDSEAATKAKALAESILNALRTGFNIIEGTSFAAKTIGQAVSDGIEAGATEADISGIDKVATNAYNALKKKLNVKSGKAVLFDDLGKAIAEGVAKGIKDNESKITQAAKDAAVAAYNAALAALDINIPSRKTAEAGAYYAQRFAKSIADHTSEAVAASGAMAQQAMYGSYIGSMSVTQNIAAVAMSENELAIQTASALQMLRFA